MYKHAFVYCNPAFGAFLQGELNRQMISAREFEKACGISKAKLSIIKKGLCHILPILLTITFASSRFCCVMWRMTWNARTSSFASSRHGCRWL